MIDIDTERLDLFNKRGRPSSTPDFVLPGLPAGEVGCLMGAENTGKTALALQIALSVAGGTEAPLPALLRHSGYPVSLAGDVVYIANGALHGPLKQRVETMASELTDSDRKSIADRLHLIPQTAHNIREALHNIILRRNHQPWPLNNRLLIVDAVPGDFVERELVKRLQLYIKTGNWLWRPRGCAVLVVFDHAAPNAEAVHQSAPYRLSLDTHGAWTHLHWASRYGPMRQAAHVLAPQVRLAGAFRGINLTDVKALDEAPS